VPQALSKDFAKSLADTAGLRRRAVTYSLHLRETNLATVLRKAAELKQPRPQKSVDELRTALTADLENYRAEMAAAGQPNADWAEMRAAIELLEKSPDEFLQKYLKEEPDRASKSVWSITSR
jgi:hypothetical protein